MNADHGSWPADGFCRVFSKVEINAGNPYTMTVELMNVIGWRGVNSGHLGVFYNAVDENNFDLIYFRLVFCLEYIKQQQQHCFFTRFFGGRRKIGKCASSLTMRDTSNI